MRFIFAILDRYDRLKEPARSLWFFVPFGLVIVGVNIGPVWVTMALIALLVAAGLFRVLHLARPKKRSIRDENPTP